MRTQEHGFTLVELLVVVAIIGLLAAIAIPAYSAQRQKGWIAQSQSALREAATAAEGHAVDNQGNYAGLNGQCSRSARNACAVGDDALLREQGFKKPSAVKVEVTADSAGYCMTATHDDLDPGPSQRLVGRDLGQQCPRLFGRGLVPHFLSADRLVRAVPQRAETVNRTAASADIRITYRGASSCLARGAFGIGACICS